MTTIKTEIGVHKRQAHHTRFSPTGGIESTDVQRAIEEVAASAVGAPSDGTYYVTSANAGLSAEVVVPAFMQSVLDDTTQGEARTTLGVGATDNPDFSGLFLTEKAAAEADVAGSGQFWVQTATPNLAMFTDDAGTDFSLANFEDLASNSNGLGASLVGIEDAGGLFTATEVEAALAENRTAIDVIEAGYVTGPASSTDNAIARFDGTTGKIIQNSGIIIDDNDDITGAAGGMAITGGTGSGDDLALSSTSNATKGTVRLGNASTGLFFDEVDERLSIGGPGNTFTFAGIGPIGIDIAIHNDEGGETCQGTFRYSNVATEAACWNGLRSRGTMATPTVVQNNDTLGLLSFFGHDGTDYEFASYIAVQVDGTPGNNDMPGRMVFLVTPDGSNIPAEAFRIQQNRDVLFASGSVLTLPNTGLHLLDTNASHDLIIAPGSDLTADRTLTLTTGDANRTLTLSGNATVSQDYSTTGNPQFATIELGHASDTTLSRSSAGVVAVEGSDLAKTEPGVNAQTGTTYTLALTNKGGIVTMSNASANVLTIPTNASVAFPVSTIINVIMLGAGTTTITGDTGVTVNGVSAGSGDIQNQYQGVSLLKIATNTWIASGDIGTVA